MYYSDDHGFYLTGPNWTLSNLGIHTAASFVLSLDSDGLDRAETGRLADRLVALTKDEIEVEVSKLPASWPVSDDELEAAIDFADQRRQGAAERLRQLLP